MFQKKKRCFILFCLVAAFILTPTTALANSTKKETAKKATKITISAAGDCTLGVDSRFNSTFNSYYNNHGSAYFLKKVKPVFAKDDITIVNLEGTFTTSNHRAQKVFTFKGPSKHVKILKKGSVEVVNIANNHTMDFGKTGYSDTISTLKKNKIKYCNDDIIAYKTVKNVKVAFLGFNALNGVSSSTVKNTIQTAKRKGAQIVIVSFHWGIEKDYYPESRQKSLARNAIDDGATLVLGHHPHVLQGIEKYKGRYIVYSLGNFCFGGNTNPADKDTMIFQQTFTVQNGIVKKNDAIKVIPCSLSSSSYTNDFQPRILTGERKKEVIQKINKMSRGMGMKFKNSGKVTK